MKNLIMEFPYYRLKQIEISLGESLNIVQLYLFEFKNNTYVSLFPKSTINKLI